MQTKTDKLNNLQSKQRSIPIRQYFDEMQITEKQKAMRIQMANKFEELFVYAFLISNVMIETDGIVDVSELANTISLRYYDAIEDMGFDMDKYPDISSYIEQISSDIANSTSNHIDDPYYTSDDRATYIAENESNSVMNSIELRDAIDNGFTMKRWNTIGDEHVRDTHNILDGTEIDIFQAFKVGNSQMLFPKDYSLGANPKEIVNCRCCVEYFKN